MVLHLQWVVLKRNSSGLYDMFYRCRWLRPRELTMWTAVWLFCAGVQVFLFSRIPSCRESTGLCRWEMKSKVYISWVIWVLKNLKEVIAQPILTDSENRLGDDMWSLIWRNERKYFHENWAQSPKNISVQQDGRPCFALAHQHSCRDVTCKWSIDSDQPLGNVESHVWEGLRLSNVNTKM